MRIYTVVVRVCTVYYVTDDEIKTIYDNMVFRLFKRTVQRDFRPPGFLSFEPAWATDQWVQIFSILVFANMFEFF